MPITQLAVLHPGLRTILMIDYWCNFSSFMVVQLLAPGFLSVVRLKVMIEKCSGDFFLFKIKECK